ncbi:uncharacterized protein C8Q71DRAFT_285302 [Rhodofomes roseus]|uniref:Uncharacterized protein n=1 Tax=Rhodofomes roseus TaxID=34475 RepID=A0ABQ8K4F3_9APHY|nr:uncharacterized protein C8Q71DRAFT_285302 [Rhodofomes roseus]KAH9831791.1 hypothetical protein C8Q71DRAFT_285302 [Rhodofomes roseus]
MSWDEENMMRAARDGRVRRRGGRPAASFGVLLLAVPLSAASVLTDCYASSLSSSSSDFVRYRNPNLSVPLLPIADGLGLCVTPVGLKSSGTFIGFPEWMHCRVSLSWARIAQLEGEQMRASSERGRASTGREMDLPSLKTAFLHDVTGDHGTR